MSKNWSKFLAKTPARRIGNGPGFKALKRINQKNNTSKIYLNIDICNRNINFFRNLKSF